MSPPMRVASARSRIWATSPTVAAMDDADRPAVITAWVDCECCGRSEKAAQDSTCPMTWRPTWSDGCGSRTIGADGTLSSIFPDEGRTDMGRWVGSPSDRCGRDAKPHFRRELKPAH